MSTQVLAVLILVPTAAVVAAVFVMMWNERRSEAETQVALVSGGVLAAWGTLMTVLAARGVFIQTDARATPPVGISLVIALVAMGAALAGTPSLRSLLTNQRSLILLNIWRLLGVVFLLLMIEGQVPALWALPTGIGDIVVGATAPAVARRLRSASGRRLAIVFNIFGLVDLVVAVGLGIMTTAGPAQVFRTTPTSALATRFPLALVPTFLVPLAIVLHVVSLWQLFGLPWAPRRTALPGGVLGRQDRSTPEVA